MWSHCAGETRRVGICVNISIRRIFNYCDHESVEDIMFRFHMLSGDLFILRPKLLLYSSALRSNRKIAVACAEW